MTASVATVGAVLRAELGDAVRFDAPLGERTTWRVGGPAAVLVEPASPAELVRAVACCDPAVPFLVVGRGSNLLVADAGFPGVAIVLGDALGAVAIESEHVTAGAGTALPVLARRCAAAGLGGLGFYVGIPGSVGGAVRMNAGGHGRETAEVLVAATVARVGGDVGSRPVEALGLGYRHSALDGLDVVVDATFRVAPAPADELRAELGEIVRWRTEHQPGGANAGSVFTNPPGDAAARLIDEECGLRGARRGGAVVSEKHANFIQAERGATAADVRELIEHVRARVEAVTGVRLHPEVHLVGFEDAAP